MSMTVRPKPALPLVAAAAIILAVSGCQAGGRASGSAGPSQPSARAASTPASQAMAAGSAATPGASGGNVKACSLLTEQELTPLLGSDPGPGTDNSDSTTTACAYTGAGVVTIVVDHSGGKSQFDAFCGTNQKVSGVADGACLTIVGGPVAAMYILKGPKLMSINIQAGLDTKITPEALIALGKIAAGRV
jgi:hypothetical protein